MSWQPTPQYGHTAESTSRATGCIPAAFGRHQRPCRAGGLHALAAGYVACTNGPSMRRGIKHDLCVRATAQARLDHIADLARLAGRHRRQRRTDAWWHRDSTVIAGCDASVESPLRAGKCCPERVPVSARAQRLSFRPAAPGVENLRLAPCVAHQELKHHCIESGRARRRRCSPSCRRRRKPGNRDAAAARVRPQPPPGCSAVGSCRLASARGDGSDAAGSPLRNAIVLNSDPPAS